MTNSREITYPIFLRCCKYVSSLYWRNILEELAYGRCPIGVHFVGGFLKCSLKKKSFAYRVENTNDEEKIKKISQDIVEIFSLRLGLEEKTNSNDSEVCENWTGVKKNNIKNMLVEKFVIESGKKWNLPVSQQKSLLSLINTNIILRNITSKDVIFEDNKITNIRGIKLEQGKFKYSREM